MSEYKVRILATTHVGLIRANNEDNFAVCQDISKADWAQGDLVALGPLGSLLIVADGIGGANAGEVASAIAIETIQRLFTPSTKPGAQSGTDSCCLSDSILKDDDTIQQFMKRVVTIADDAIQSQSMEDEEKSGMGTTIVMAWILDNKAYVCWCGDSRCYLYRPSQKALWRVSHDHSYVQELVDCGELDESQAFSHPMSNIITRCLGNDIQKDEADTIVCELKDGDVLMLCSDGLCGQCEDIEIAEVIGEHHGSLEKCLDELITSALNAGGHDNVTVALAAFSDDSGAKIRTG